MDNNPFSAPESAPLSPSFQFTDYREIKKFYYYSRNASAIAYLNLIFGTLSLAVFFSGSAKLMLTFAPIILFNLVVSIGLLKRKNWGRILGIIHCAMMLAGIPIGTIIGIIGLNALIKGRILFGEDPITTKQLKQAMDAAKS